MSSDPDDDAGMAKKAGYKSDIPVMGPHTLLADGFEKAFIGWFTRVGKPTVCVYDIDKCLAILMLRDNMTEEGAREYLEFNTIGAWMGEGTPAFMQRGTLQEFKDGQDL